MNEDSFAWAKKITDEYRRIRRYFSMDFYNLASSRLDDTSWAVWQYHNEKTQSGIVMAFRRSNSPFEKIKVDLKGLLNGRTYKIVNTDDQESMNITNSIEIVLPKKRSSVILEYKLNDK